jgi:hypothetical protein
VLVRDGGDQKIYTRPSDALSIGDASISGIYYLYYKGRLMTIRVSTKGLSNSRMVLDTFIMSYGPGYQNNKYIEKYTWDGKTVDMSYTQDREGNSLVDIDSEAILAQQLEDHFKNAEKGKSDI